MFLAFTTSLDLKATLEAKKSHILVNLSTVNKVRR